MKKIIKYLLIITIFIPIFINAKQYKYNDAVNKANQYITDFPNFHDYIVIENMPYDYIDGIVLESSKFTKGGFISRDEYEITNYRRGSYLATGLEYWTLTQYDSKKIAVISYTMDEKKPDQTSNARITQYVKNEVKVGGSGTKNNPWYFVDITNVNLVSSDTNRGTLSTKPCTNKSQGKNLIVVNKYEDSKAQFYVCEDTYFRYYDTTCDSYIDVENGEYFVKDGIPDNTICRINFGYRTHKLTLENCDGCDIQQPSPTTIYKAQNSNLYFVEEYGVKPNITSITIPKKTGYTFDGYYKDEEFKTTPVIKNTGEFNSGDITQDSTLHLKMEPNKYTVKYDCNGGEGSTTSTQHIYDKLQKLQKVGCYKNGYIFKGWGKTTTGPFEYSDETEVKNLNATNGGVTTLYAGWEKCAAGYYSEGISLNCSKCAAGTYSTAGSSSCSTCPVGTYSAAGAGSCTNCAVGTYNPNTGSTSSSACIKCPVGTYNATQGASSCTNCPSGYTSSSGATAQNKCYITVQDGKYIATANTSTQTNCAAGTYKTSHTVYYGNTSSCSACQTCYTNTAGSKTCPTLITYTVSYNMNGGSGGPSSQTKTCGSDLTLSTVKPERDGYVFDGWNTNSSGTGTNYASGGKYSNNSAVTLYAKWKVARVYLVQNGVTQSIVGGWKGKGQELTSAITNHQGLVSGRDGNYLMFVHDDWRNTTGGSYSVNKIDMTNYSKLRFEGTLYSGTMQMGGSLRIHSSVGSHVDDGAVMSCWTTAVQQYKNASDCDFNISSLRGSYYVGVHMFGNGYYNSGSKSNNYIRIKNMWLE